jgi:regulator of replication initiation timing
MKGKIACSAQRLSLLDPAMIKAVVEGSALHVANQYRTENRVRITDADERQITSVVIGNSGVYQLSIQLKDGTLTTKCSCPLNEQPLCRHSVAVLLEYHRWAQVKAAPRSAPKAGAVSPAAAPSNVTSSALDIKLSEVTIFIEWLQGSVRALEQGQTLPEAPALGAGEVVNWIKAVQSLEERRRHSDEKYTALEEDLRAREGHLGRLTQQLQTSMEETKAAQTACDTLRRQLAEHASTYTKLAELVKNLEGVQAQVKRIAGEFVNNVSQLDGLSGSLKEASTVLHALSKKS